jgi:hypothetical protein
MNTVGTCSRVEAQALAEKFQMGDANYGRVAQVLCGSFTGSQSTAMAFSFHWYGCVPFQGWAVFRVTAGEWQLVLERKREVAVLAAVGSDIRATVDVFRAGDSHCVWSGGKRSRVWHWDGQRFVGGPSKQVTPPTKKVPSFGGFKTPSGNIFCNYAFGYVSRTRVPFLICGIKSGIKPPAPRKGPECTRHLWPVMYATGPAGWSGSTCPGHDTPQGPSFDHAPVLGYGKSWRWNGMSCTSAFAGLTCRNQSGHGFFMSRAKTRLF